MKKIIIIVFLFITLVCPVSASEYSPYATYTYAARNGDILPSPDAYVVSDVIRLGDYGLNDFNSPQDLFIDMKGNSYIADTNNNRIVFISKDRKSIKVIDKYNDIPFNRPTGIFMDAQNRLYIADSGNNQVVRLLPDYNLDKIYKKPDSSLLEKVDAFKPVKVSVSSLGNIYIICENIFEGILEINENGSFVGYAGMNKVSPSFMDLAWRAISTNSQKRSMVAFLPITFLNMDIDNKDFIYATSQMESNSARNAVKRLNPGGVDVLINNSGLPIIGDLINNDNEDYSRFKDICYLKNGIYAMVDSVRGRVFVYSPDGYPMFIFGGTGGMTGQMTSPTAIDHFNETLYVLDGSKNQINIYSPTNYGKGLIDAVAEYDTGNYEDATSRFSELIRFNSNCEVAYIGLGKAYQRSGEYEFAMKAFQLADNRIYYSKALKVYRNDKISKDFIWIGLIVLILLLFLIMKKPILSVRKRYFPPKVKTTAKFPQKNFIRFDTNKYFDSLGFASYISFHPFKGFYDMKREKQGTLLASNTILFLYILVVLAKKIATGFVFSSGNPSEVNLLFVILQTLAPIILFCAANWCLTTLMDGEGSFKDIIMMIGYSLLPALLIQIPVILASNVLTLEEGAFLKAFEIISILFTFFLIFIGTLTIHQYSLKKTILTGFLTILGMAIILFIGFIFINIGYEVFDYFKSIYRELIFR